ncbi:MAG: hypothetical protein JWQ01_2431 [Massilia sp.]|jgi:hypothetical protein|nr:hypothetical protein [Massilia sp.]
MGRATRVANTVLLGAAFMLGMPGAASARDGVRSMVYEMVKVESRDGKVLVRLTIDNQGDSTIYVPRSVASEQELFGNWFEVRDSSNGDPLAYIGPVVKRAPLGKGDFVAVKPHSRHRNTIDITNAYAFVAGRHAYQLNYAGTYVSDLKSIAQVTPIEPASVMFAHVGK